MTRLASIIALIAGVAGAQDFYDTRGLIGAWCIDGNAPGASGVVLDWSGQNNHGTPTSRITDFEDGAPRFDKHTNSLIQLSQNINTRVLTNQGFTVMWWARMTTPPNFVSGGITNHQSVLSGMITGGDFDGFQVEYTTDVSNHIYLGVGYNANEAGYYSFPSRELYLNRWQHIALTAAPISSGNKMGVVRYLNGIRVGTVDTNYVWMVNGIGIAARVGNAADQSSSQGGGAFVGHLADVLLYQRVLTPEEIYEAYSVRRRR